MTNILTVDYDDAKRWINFINTDVIHWCETFRTPYTPDFSDKQREFLQAIQRGDKHIVLLWCRQTGKSTIFGYVINYWLFTGVREHVIIAAPVQDQAIELYDRTSRVIRFFPVLENYIVKMNSERIILYNGNKASFLSASPGSHIRGKTGTKIVLDETGDITDNKYYGDIMPFLATIDKWVLIESGTPRRKNHFFTVLTKPGVTVIRQMWWECVFLNKDYVLEQKAKNPEALFRQEYECEFIEEGAVVFPEKWFFKEQRKKVNLSYINILEDYAVYTNIEDIKTASRKFKNAVKGGAIFVMGYDQGRMVDNAVLRMWRVDKFPLKVVYSKVYPLGTTNPTIAAEMKYLYNLCQVNELNIDWTGEKGFMDFMTEYGLPTPIVKDYKYGLVVFNSMTKTLMMTNLQALIQKGLIRLPKRDEVGFQQWIQQQYEITSNNKFKYYHPTNSHDDILWADALALKNVGYTMDDLSPINFANVWEEHNKKLGLKDMNFFMTSIEKIKKMPNLDRKSRRRHQFGGLRKGF